MCQVLGGNVRNTIEFVEGPTAIPIEGLHSCVHTIIHTVDVWWA